MKAAVAAMIGAVSGIAISAWWLAPKHSPEELHTAEAELSSKMDQEDMAADIAALKGHCAEGQVKATPTGRIGECKGGRWTAPGAPALDAKLKLKAIHPYNSRENHMNKPDVQPTVEAIRHMAAALREKAVQMDRIADQMQATGNIELAATAVNVAATSVGPLDWLVTRPLRAVADLTE